MGKDLKGKELGVGISQRKDGLYTARFTDRNGKRKQQYAIMSICSMTLMHNVHSLRDSSKGS